MTLFLHLITVALVFVGVCTASSIRIRMKNMSAALDRLTAEVTKNTTVIGSAKALISGLAKQIRDNSGNEDALNKLADELDANNSTDLTGAVVENTPVADEPTA